MRQIIVGSISLAIFALALGCSDDEVESVSLRIAGFETPESVIHDTVLDLYLVSNIAGAGAAVDGNGFISRVTPSGEVIDPKWIDGASPNVTLNAPKGMAIANGRLYVADITVVRKFSLDSGAPDGEITIPNVTFLNDLVASPDGTVYVSDSGFNPDFSASGTDAVYAIDAQDNVTTIIQDSTLGAPNGLLWDLDGLYVVTFSSGDFFRVRLDNGQREALESFSGAQLDGLARAADGDWLISDWTASQVLKGRDGNFSPVLTGVASPADIAFDAGRQRVLVPLFNDNVLIIQTVRD